MNMNTILTNHTMSIPNRLAYLLALGFLCVFTMTDSYPEELPVVEQHDGTADDVRNW